jgi:hypothetical protein
VSNPARPDDDFRTTNEILRRITDLENRINRVAPVSTVGQLPALPSEGQEIYYQPEPPSGLSSQVIWHLKRVGEAWVSIGQQEPWALYLDNLTGSASGSFTNIGPSITVPSSGVWRVEIVIHYGAPEAAGAGFIAGAMLNAVAPTRYVQAQAFSPTAAFSTGDPYQDDFTCDAGDVLAIGHARTNAALAARVKGRWLSVRPLQLD